MARTQQQRSALAGGWAEQRALRLLRSRGWRLLDRNWRCRWGELDLVVRKPGRLLVVEVKGRCSGLDGWGTAALQRGKGGAWSGPGTAGWRPIPTRRNWR